MSCRQGAKLLPTRLVAPQNIAASSCSLPEPDACIHVEEEMLRNSTSKSLSILQKTYDESYLTCSTAVYYENQVRPLRHIGTLGIFSSNLYVAS